MPDKAPSGVTAPAAPWATKGKRKRTASVVKRPTRSRSSGRGSIRVVRCVATKRAVRSKAGTASSKGGTTSSRRGRARTSPTSNQRQTKRSQRSAGQVPSRRRCATNTMSRAWRGASRPACRRRRMSGTAHGRFQARCRRSSLGRGENQLSSSSRCRPVAFAHLEAGLVQEGAHLVVAQLGQVVGAVGPLRAVGPVGQAQPIRSGEDQRAAGTSGPARKSSESGTGSGRCSTSSPAKRASKARVAEGQGLGVAHEPPHFGKLGPARRQEVVVDVRGHDGEGPVGTNLGEEAPAAARVEDPASTRDLAPGTGARAGAAWPRAARRGRAPLACSRGPREPGGSRSARPRGP